MLIYKYALAVLLAGILSVSVFGFAAYASTGANNEGSPTTGEEGYKVYGGNNQGNEVSQGAESSQSSRQSSSSQSGGGDFKVPQPETDIANEIFSADIQLPDVSDNPVNRAIAKIAGWFIAIAITLLPALFTVITICDLFYLGVPVARTFLSRYMPLQLISDTAIGITGVPYSRVSPKSGDGSGMASTAEKVDLNGKNKWAYWLWDRLLTTVISMGMALMISTGMWQRIMNFCINHIAGWVMKLLG